MCSRDLILSGHNGYLFVEWKVHLPTITLEEIREHERQMVMCNDIVLKPDVQMWHWVPDQVSGKLKRVFGAIVERPAIARVENFILPAPSKGTGRRERPSLTCDQSRITPYNIPTLSATFGHTIGRRCCCTTQTKCELELAKKHPSWLTSYTEGRRKPSSGVTFDAAHLHSDEHALNMLMFDVPLSPTAGHEHPQFCACETTWPDGKKREIKVFRKQLASLCLEKGSQKHLISKPMPDYHATKMHFLRAWRMINEQNIILSDPQCPLDDLGNPTSNIHGDLHDVLRAARGKDGY